MWFLVTCKSGGMSRYLQILQKYNLHKLGSNERAQIWIDQPNELDELKEKLKRQNRSIKHVTVTTDPATKYNMLVIDD